MRPRIDQESCSQCRKNLAQAEQILYVEEEVGRVFCSESCIIANFAPEIDRLEKEYQQWLEPDEIPAKERESLEARLRSKALHVPDEVWREHLVTGDLRYYLITQFKKGRKPIWVVCICLFLKGEPSFLFMSFVTNNPRLSDRYRRGDRVQWVFQSDQSVDFENFRRTDSRADDWTSDDTLRAQLIQERKLDDIPIAEFDAYQKLLEATVELPDEVWITPAADTRSDEQKEVEGEESSVDNIIHFIKKFSEEDPAVWYVVVAKDNFQEEDEIEILDAFPTRDPSLVDKYRQGSQDLDFPTEPGAQNRIVH